MRRVLSLLFSLFLLGLCLPLGAQDDQYVRIYGLIQEGDGAYGSRQYATALAKYRDALQQLQSFQRSYPNWNNNIVKYRLSFLEAVINEITVRHAAALAPVEPAATNAPAAIAPTVPAETEAQIATLQNQIRQLQTENSTLESKLKEALRVQPAAADPRALERAEQQVRSLQKENALLKVNLADRPAADASADPKALEQLRKQLAETNQKAAESAERVSALIAEKGALEKKLVEATAAAENPPVLVAARKELESVKRQLELQSEAMSKLALEKTALQERTTSMAAELEALAALRAEHEIVKKQLAEAKGQQAESERLGRDLTAAKAQVAVLTSDQNVLKLENAALEQRLKAAQAAKHVTNVVVQANPADAARIQQLEREREDLQKQLEAAQKELAGLKSRGNGNVKLEELQNDIQVLRTRLAVIETQKMPYTEEEEELIRKAEASVVAGKTGRASSRNLPPGAMVLVNEAQKEFAARRFDQAEAKYQEVLKLDEKNTYTRANLAAIQIELQRYDEAEKNLNVALTNAPDDAYSLSLLGFLRFRQNRFDDALDALGRAGKLDPQNAEIQNYLGLTLSQKGLRKAAEQALRKAIMIDPNYASAHYNLAVIYLAQQPPQVELARVHYRKAVAAGIQPSADMERMLGTQKEAP